ncbi:TPA: hypothetical protein ACRZ2U_004744 [Vibrio harveyi]
MIINKEEVIQSIERFKDTDSVKANDIYHRVLKDVTGICIFSSFLTQEGKNKVSEFDTIFQLAMEEIEEREYRIKLAAVDLTGLTEVEKGNHVNQDIYKYGRGELDRIRTLFQELDDDEKREIKPFIDLYNQTIGSSFNFGTASSVEAQQKNDLAFRVIDKMFAKKFGMHICEIRHRLEMSEEEWVMTAKGQ